MDTVVTDYVTYPQVEKLIIYELNDMEMLLIFYMNVMNQRLGSENGIHFDVNEIKEKWKKCCWKCLKMQKPDEHFLKSCSACKLAKYCNRNCQKADWAHHKKIHEIEKADKEGSKQEEAFYKNKI